MCFSATASFALAAVLLPAGIRGAAKSRRDDPGWLGMALFPAAFAVQQAVEGVLWLGLDAGDEVTVAAASRGFLFFSHFFWLAWPPLSVFWLEREAWRRRALLALSGAAALFGMSIFLPAALSADGLSVEIVQHSLRYDTALIYERFVDRSVLRGLYAAIVLSALLLSSEPEVRLFGGVIAFSLIVAHLFFDHAFISVWCFFAAVLSLYLVVAGALRQRRLQRA